MTSPRHWAQAIIYDDGVNNRATPKGMLVTVAFLALYGAFAIWFGVSHRIWVMDAVGLVAAIACVAAAAKLRWSRYLVYALSLALALTWLFSIYAAARLGFYSVVPRLTIIASLLPDALLLGVACFSSRMVHRHLGRPVAMPAPAPAA